MKSRHTPAAAAQFARRLPRYAVAAAAVAAPALPGAIVHVTNSFSVPVGNPGVHVWDINGDSTTDFTFDNTLTGEGRAGIYAHRGAAADGWVKFGSTSNQNRPRQVPASFSIGPARLASSIQNSAVALFTISHNHLNLAFGDQLVGFTFTISGQQNYGWANITLGPNSLTFHDWAYESSPDTAIPAGATSSVPEPAQAATGLGLLALGAAGVARFKRQRAAK